MSGMNRRNFLTTSAGGAAAAPMLFIAREGWAAEKVAPDDPTAVALGYVEDATKATRPAADQFCDNCFQYTATEDGWGTCNLIPGKLVAAKGWCKVWVLKQ